jgi:outer membrane protein TolC
MTKAILLSVAFALMPYHCLFAENEQHLSLQELFEMADNGNTDIGAKRIDLQVAEQQKSVARTARLPQINASLTLSYLGDGTIIDRDFSHATRDRLPHFDNTLAVELYQPVFAGGAINSGIKLAETQSQLANVGLQASRNDIRFQVVRNSLELMKSRNLLEVYIENIRLTEKLISEMQARRDQGVVLKNDITRYELKLSSLGYDKLATENAIKICNHNLTSLLGLDSDVEIYPEMPESFANLNTNSANEWLNVAQANAVPLQSLRLQGDAARLGKKIAQSEYFPKVGLVAVDNFLGPVTFEVPVIDKNYNSWFLGVNVKWNISSLFTTAKSTRKKSLEIEHISQESLATSDAIDRQIREAHTLYTQAIDRLEIERKNMQLATENYNVVSNRFDNQLALLTDMLDASNARLEAGVRLVNAEISAKFYYYQLHYIAGTLTNL